MNAMIERGASVLLDEQRNLEEIPLDDIARAVLWAALDPSDDVMVAFVVGAVRAAQYEGFSREDRRFIAARAAIMALRLYCSPQTLSNVEDTQ